MTMTMDVIGGIYCKGKEQKTICGFLRILNYRARLSLLEITWQSYGVNFTESYICHLIELPGDVTFDYFKG